MSICGDQSNTLPIFLIKESIKDEIKRRFTELPLIQSALTKEDGIFFDIGNERQDLFFRRAMHNDLFNDFCQGFFALDGFAMNSV